MSKIPISEIFHSIQGEGATCGQPAVFVRVGGCNLKCSFCDTFYASRKEYKNVWKQMSVDKIYEKIREFRCYRVVLTGGEPLLYQNALKELICKLKMEEYKIEIETNGTILPAYIIAYLVDLFNVSPKLSNSGNPLRLREKPEVIEFFNSIENSIFKFVVSNKSDAKEALNFAKKYRIKLSKVWLMPECKDFETFRKTGRWLVDFCKTFNVNFSPRLQIVLWNSKKGV
jgi:7-cyano-7-deazaguanosine (preQ0) biosynthesis protein QueE